VGFYLEQHKEDLLLEDTALDPLRKLRPKQPHYLERARRRDCQWIKGWNLMVPVELGGSVLRFSPAEIAPRAESMRHF
jgi:hypothetical protein